MFLKLSHFYALWLFNFLQNSNLYMKFMNKITETRYSFIYLIKNEKNTTESPKFGNGHIQLIRTEKSTGQIRVEVWFG